MTYMYSSRVNTIVATILRKFHYETLFLTISCLTFLLIFISLNQCLSTMKLSHFTEAER